MANCNGGIGTDINGANQDTYTVTATSINDGLSVRCLVSSDLTCLIESDIANLSLDMPTISQQPINQVVCEGNIVSYSIIANSPSGGQLIYQWQSVSGGVATDINGAIQDTYSLTSTAADDGIKVQVIVSSPTGCTVLSLSLIHI